MQILLCPFCGARPETEFSFAAEAGKTRPEPASDVSDDAWAGYLHTNRNVKGAAREIWQHLTCGEYFALTRDTVTHAILASDALPVAASSVGAA
jgi:sarcosine oxidase subunit delta